MSFENAYVQFTDARFINSLFFTMKAFVTDYIINYVL